MPAVPLLLGGLAMPTICAHLVLAVAYNVCTTALLRFGLQRQVSLISLVALFVLAFIYNSRMVDLISAIARPPRWGHERSRRGRLRRGTAPGGFLATSALFFALLAVLIPAAMLTAPRRYPDTRRYGPIRVPGAGLTVWPYAVAIVRRSETWVTVGVAYVAAVFMFSGEGNGFLYAAGFLVTQGIYAYSTTSSLRSLPGYRRSARAEVALLLGAQGAIYFASSLPIFALVLARPDALVAAVGVALGCGSMIVMSTLIGIIFPPDRDNPFSAFVSYLICIVTVLAGAAMFGVLSLPVWLLVAFAVLAHFLAVYYSIVGINIARRKARYA